MTVKAIVFDAYGTLFDIQSVAAVTDEAYPGYGEVITQIWRLKQLEYTWLRSLMGRYADFWAITQESLAYTLDGLGLDHDRSLFDRIMDKYCHLELYPDAKQALTALKNYRLAILSNGSQQMLDDVVRNSGLASILEAVISVDSRKIFKPSPEVYELIQTELGVGPHEVLFVSSNAFDVCGAKNYGLKVTWVERVTAQALKREIGGNVAVRPATMFKALRMRMEPFGFDADFRVNSLAELPLAVAKAG
ncbi:MAG: haloacid dehalogenase type II [Rhizobiales bacterium]|nr:haloacid dehalogenase type II [Hyphomicrobiales bacterium]